MCGIFGSVNVIVNSEFMANAMPKLLHLQDHRGPDNCGYYVDKSMNYVLGHNRLSVVDLTEAGSQPMKSACGKFIIVYNGEIYNTKYLIKKYLPKVCLKSCTDTEVLLEIASRVPLEKFLEDVDGMFAFALLNVLDGSLQLARDKVGQKPLYYATNEKELFFASEVQTLVQGYCVSDKINAGALYSYCSFGFVAGQQSIWDGIRKIKPGTIISFNCGTGVLEQRTYFDGVFCYPEKSRQNDTQLIYKIEDALRQSVQEQLIADVPVGVFLSGGIDSTLISYYASKHTSNIKAFTVGFEDKDYDETPHAKKLADTLGLEHYVYQAKPADIPTLLKEHISKLSEPLADISMIPTLALSKFARDHVKVVLSGDGADELFMGYSRHIYLKKYWPTLSLLPKNLRQSIAWILGKTPRVFREVILSSFFNDSPQISDKIVRILNIFGSNSIFDAYVRAIELKTSSELRKSFPNCSQTIIDNPKLSLIEDYIRYMDFVNYLESDVLVKTDRMSMLASLECRAPFLSNRMIKLSEEIPKDSLVRNGQGKFPLRKLLSVKMKNVDYRRAKYGFSLPIAIWLRGELKCWAEERIFSNEILELGVFNLNTIERNWQNHVNEKENYGDQFMMLCVLSEWLAYWKTNVTNLQDLRVV